MRKSPWVLAVLLAACSQSPRLVPGDDLPPADTVVPTDDGTANDAAPDAAGPRDADADPLDDSTLDAPDLDTGSPPTDTPPEAETDACLPQCGEARCGDDGCGGQCGTCTGGSVCTEGTCECVPQTYRACCGQAVCWFDSCGVQGLWILDCPKGCQNARCLDCTSQCDGKACGEDGCGGECGQCTGGRCDGLAWTMPAVCVGGACMGGGATQDCGDGNACTKDSCAANTGCRHSVREDGSTCDAGRCDEGTWTRPRTCTGGVCGGGGGTEPCQDGNPCTDDACRADAGCLFTPTVAPCDDGDPCTTGDACNQGTCTGSGTLDCDDDNPCTTESCASGVGCGHANVQDGDPCGPGKCVGTVFTPGASCLGGTCSGTGSARDCDDGRPCTMDGCDPSQGCSHALIDGNCLIDGACHPNGAALGDCLRCDSSLDPAGWTPLSTCDDGLDCTTDTCDTATGACRHAVLPGSCRIDGACRTEGTPGPEPCQVCSPAKAPEAWSAMADGTPCGAGTCDQLAWTKPGTCQGGTCASLGTENCDDGRSCTQDACGAAGCTHALLPDRCLIAGGCHAAGDSYGRCQECRPTTRTDAWTYVPAKACDDDASCTKDDRCIPGGTGDAGCQGTAYTCDDGLACTTDVCDGAGGCSHPLAAGTCLIDGQCHGAGQANPADPCRACDPGASPTAWSPAADGTPCAAASCNGTTFVAARTCAAGQCTGGGVSQDCTDGKACTADTCTASGCANPLLPNRCFIDNTCLGDGQVLANACKMCWSATSTTQWTNAADGATCGGGGLVCIGGQCTGHSCGGTLCPDLAGYTVSCSSYARCLYAPADTSGWRKYDVWIYVPPGVFDMGAPADEAGSSTDERPVHTVSVLRGYFLAMFEATVSAWSACVAAGSCTAPGTQTATCNWGVAGKDFHPANCITWSQARAYCAWNGDRLCTEAEWEFGATGTPHRLYPWGSTTASCTNAVMDDGGTGCGTGSTMVVGSKIPGASRQGAVDMGGNVWEWVEDDYHLTYTGAPTNGTAWVDSPRATQRTFRGGSLVNAADQLRTSNRHAALPTYNEYLLGVRCCRTRP